MGIETLQKKESLMPRNIIFLFLLTLLPSIGCSSFGKVQDEPPQQPTEEVIRELRNDLSADMREILREELLPEIQGLSSAPKQKRQRLSKAKKAALEKIVIGRIEWIYFNDPKMKIRARVDTGAQTCSIHAENVQEKMIEGEKFVQFESEDFQGKKHVFLKRVIDSTLVRSSTGESNRRYVVRMSLTLGSKEYEINVNLNDRSSLRYNFLIGRNLLMGNYIVDVSQSRLLGRN